MMRGLLAVLSSNSDIYFNARYTKVYYISLNSQKKELSELMSYMKIHKEVKKRGGSGTVKLNFYFLFFALRYLSEYSSPKHKTLHTYRKYSYGGKCVSDS